MNELLNLLKKNPGFGFPTKDDMNLMARQSLSGQYDKGEKVILYGEVWPYLFLVGKGSIEAVKESGEGRTLMINAFLTGDIFWGLAFFQVDAPMPVTLEAREASELSLWPREMMVPILERNGRVAWELSCLMAGRMQRASEIVEELAFHPVAGRLARLLLDHFESAGDSAIS